MYFYKINYVLNTNAYTIRECYYRGILSPIYVASISFIGQNVSLVGGYGLMDWGKW